MAGPLALIWDLIAVDNASEVFGKVGAEAGALSAETKGAGAAFLGLGAIVAVAGAAMAVVSVKMAADMQESTAKIAGNAQVSTVVATRIGDAFLATAGKSTFSGKAMSDALGPVAGVIQTLSGKTLNAASAMKVMNAATMLAEATGQPLAATTANLAAVMQNYHIGLSGAAGASNTLFNASRLTNIDLDTLTTTVDKLHGKLGIAAPTLTGVSALLVDLANHGISGSKGVLVVNSGLTTLLGGSKATGAELKNLGAHVFDSSGKFVGMQSVLEQITPKLAAMSDKQRLAAETALFGAGAGKALNSTILAGVDGFDKATAAVTKHGAAEYAAKTAAETLQGRMKTLGAGFSDVMTTLGEKLIPYVLKALDAFTKLGAWISTNVIPVIHTLMDAFKADGLSGFFSKLSEILGKVLPLIVAQLGKWAKAFVEWIGPMIPPFLAELGNLAKALGIWIINTALPALVNGLKEWGSAFIKWVGPMIPPALVELGKVLVAIGAWIVTTALPAIIGKLHEWAVAFMKWVGPMIPPFLVELGKLLVKLGSWLLTTALPTIVSKLAEWALAFAKWVPGAAASLIAKMGGLLVSLGGWILTTALPAIVKKIGEWELAFLKWVANVVVSLPGKLVSLLGVITTWAGAVPGKIVTALGNLGTLLLKAGSSIMDGLLSGIKAGWDKVAGFVSGIASKIAALKGPLPYDRQLLIGAGDAIMAGLNEGLTTGFGKVQNNVGSMAGRLSIGSLDFASSAVRSSAINGATAATGASNADLIAEVQGLRADIRALPKDYQMGQRQLVGR